MCDGYSFRSKVVRWFKGLFVSPARVDRDLIQLKANLEYDIKGIKRDIEAVMQIEGISCPNQLMWFGEPAYYKKTGNKVIEYRKGETKYTPTGVKAESKKRSR